MIYLDYNATSPLRPEVRQALAPFLEEAFGNASSLHAMGRQARQAVEAVREELLLALGDPKGTLIFTSGGTEADNLALRGVALAHRARGRHLIISAVEHHAVLHTAGALKAEGLEVTEVGVNRDGWVDLAALRRAITSRTILISVMHANNEIGVIQPIEEVGRIAREHGVFFHTDAVQSFGKLPLDVKKVNADLVSLSGHKLGGPKGVGALYVRLGLLIAPLLHGGPHEKHLRAGTENVAGIVGMGAAARVSLREMANGKVEEIGRLRDRLEAGLVGAVPGLVVHGRNGRRLANTLHVNFPGCEGETCLAALDLAGICVSTGAACSSGSTEPSHVLGAMGLPNQEIEGSIRFSLGWATTEAEIEACLEKVPPVIEQVQKAYEPG